MSGNVRNPGEQSFSARLQHVVSDLTRSCDSQDDELYSGYNEANPLAGAGAAQMFQPVATPSGRGPGQAPGTANQRLYTASNMRQGTAAGESSGRPMTSNRSAGFSSAPQRGMNPIARAGSPYAATGPPGQAGRKPAVNPEEQARNMERAIHELIEQSATLCRDGDAAAGLDKATEARKRERALCKFRESSGLGEQLNLELTFAASFNLAHVMHLNKMYHEALEEYADIVRNKQLPQAPRLRINMGNIHFEQRKYSNAIKMYRMALDQMPATARELRARTMRNIGLAFVRLGQYQDAAQAFEGVLEAAADTQAAFNLVVCAFALGDKDAMRRAFVRLAQLPGVAEADADDDEDEELDGDDDVDHVMRDDGLKDELKRRRGVVHKYILSSARLIADKLDRSGGFVAGYDWCTEQVRIAGNGTLANEIQLAKADKFLSRKEFDAAISVFKEFEKKQPLVRARAATNLSFLYLLEGKYEAADRYSDLALKTDRYNARAYVNKAGVLLERGDLEGARALYNEAVAIDPMSVEGIYNYGLVNLKLGELQDAISAFRKLHNMLPDNLEVIYQIANCFDLAGDNLNAIKWLEMLTSLVPNDAGVLARLGLLHHRNEDPAKALHCFQESHRVFPASMDVISWLGAHYVRSEVYEKAMPYFDLASKIQPNEVKWALMVASCYRRIGAYPQALAKYRSIHAEHPDNVECLRYLVHILTELGRRDEVEAHMEKLRRAERQQAAEQQRQQQHQGGMQGDDDVPHDAGSADDSPKQQQHLGPSPLEASLAAGNSKSVKTRQQGRSDMNHPADDWGDEQLGDDLLPM